MKRIILQEFATVDGYAADVDGRMDFQQDYVAKQDASFLADAGNFLDSIDTMLLGANTYRMFAGYWPNATETDPIADRINLLARYVVSTSLTEAPWGDLEPAVLINDNVIEKVAALKQQDGKDIVVWGSMTLGHSLMKEGLIDEVQLRVCPAVLGDGKPVFTDKFDMDLIDATKYDGGLVLLRYRAG